MSDMIERVARKMFEMDGGTWGVEPHENAPTADYWRKRARVAIAAMREPTEPMIAEGWRLLRGNLRPDEIFPHMIDAALAPPPSCNPECERG